MKDELETSIVIRARRRRSRTLPQHNGESQTVGEKYHISDDIIRKYILGLEEGFKPGIYVTMGDAELLIDIHLFIKNLGEVH